MDEAGLPCATIENNDFQEVKSFLCYELNAF